VRVAVAAAGDEEADTLHIDDVGGRVGGVVGTAAGGADVDKIAVAAVEGEEAVTGAGVLPPAGGDAGDDNEIAVDGGGDGAAAVGGDEAELFGEGALPEQFAEPGVGGEGAVDAEDEDVTGEGVDGGRGPGGAVGRDVA
jgi:hypothetical protein